MSEEHKMTYIERMQRVNAITKQIQEAAVDPADLLDLIREARSLLEQCNNELTHIEKELGIDQTAGAPTNENGY